MIRVDSNSGAKTRLAIAQLRICDPADREDTDMPAMGEVLTLDR